MGFKHCKFGSGWEQSCAQRSYLVASSGRWPLPPRGHCMLIGCTQCSVGSRAAYARYGSALGAAVEPPAPERSALLFRLRDCSDARVASTSPLGRMGAPVADFKPDPGPASPAMCGLHLGPLAKHSPANKLKSLRKGPISTTASGLQS